MPKRNTKSASQILDDYATCVKEGALDDRIGRGYEFAYSHGEHDHEIAEEFSRRAKNINHSILLGRHCPFRKPNLRKGKIVWGFDRDKHPIHIVLQWLIAGVLFLGNTGSTKTNRIKWLVLNAARHLDGLLITDFYKTEMRHLRPLLARYGISLVVIPTHEIRFNLLQADRHVDPHTHTSIVVDTFQRCLSLPPRALTVVRQIIHDLYVAFGIYRGRTDCWPTLYDLFERVKQDRSLNSQAREAILDRLGAFLIDLRNTAAYRLGWYPSDLLAGRHIVLELRDASEHFKTALSSYVLFSVLYDLLAQNTVNARMSRWLLFEDAQRFFTARSEYSTGITPLEEVAGLIRGAGAALGFTCQTMHGIPRGLIPNLGTKVMLRAGSNSDYELLGRDMGMNAAQLAWVKRSLMPGMAITQLPDGSRLPFVSYVPKLKIPADVSDHEAIDSMKALSTLKTVEAKEFGNWSPYETITVNSRVDPVPPCHGLSDAAIALLRAVQAYPGRKSSEYSKLAGIGNKQQVKIRKQLVAQGYLEENKIAASPRGRASIIPVLTAAGIKLLESINTKGN